MCMCCVYACVYVYVCVCVCTCRWEGSIGDRSGIFPANYVERYYGPGTGSGSGAGSGSVSGGAGKAKPAATSRASIVRTGPILERAIALYDNLSEAGQPGDLFFNTDEIITLTMCVPGEEWWEGMIGARAGIFPANYVKKLTGTEEEVKMSFEQRKNIKKGQEKRALKKAKRAKIPTGSDTGRGDGGRA